jgi:hypothetical protein
MNQASPVDMRKALKVVEVLKKNMILFVPVPVTSDEDHSQLIADSADRFEQLAQQAEQEEQTP